MNIRTQPVTVFLLPLLLVILTTASLTRAANAPAPVSPDNLGGADRYLAYVSTDKPIYRTAENVYLRTVILKASDNTPLEAGSNTIKIQISGPKGDVVHEGFASDNNSAIGFQWSVPDGIAGGQYTATVTSPTLGFPASERSFDVRAYRAPRVRTQIEFTRDGYGPGDQVNASISIERAEGDIPKGARVTAIARVDGNEVYRGITGKMSPGGVVNTSFTLPDTIDVGEGSVSFVIEDGGIVETASKTLPIVLQQLDISFYPESGELVAGVQSRVYFQALLPNGKPADVQGRIVELNSNTPGSNAVAVFKSEHEGRGLFSITPQKGKRYAAVFTAPSGISRPAELPQVKNTGAVIKSTRAVYRWQDNIDVLVTSNGARSAARLTLHKRETLLDSRDVSTELVPLDAKDAEGVLIVTAWDANGQPLAERLIYRQPRFGLNVELKLSNGPYIPGAEVSVDVLTTDNQGNPVEAIVGVTVADDTVLELIEKRQQAPRLPVMVYLENEVRDLADAHVYLHNTDPRAATATDLLLGIQGWRRFVLVDYTKLKKRFPTHAARIMAENSPPEFVPFARKIGLEMALAGPAVVPMLAEQPIQALHQDDAMQVQEVAEEEQAVQAIEHKLGIGQQKPAADTPLANFPQARGKEIALMDRADMDIMMARPEPLGYVREFSFQVRANRQPNDRLDFSETLYWNSGVKTGARDGRATIKFALSDSVTTFRLLADAYARNGALGIGEAVIASVEPFYISAKMPLHAVASDLIDLPVTLVNTSAKAIDNATLVVSGEGIEQQEIAPVTLASGQRLRRIIKIATNNAGTFPVTIKAQAGPYSDTVTRNLTISAAGFPVSVSEGGLLSSDSAFSTNLTVPADVTNGSLKATAKVYPSPLASMEEALNALLRQPHGCFEQTSSTNYPLVMAQQYFDSHTGIDPKKIDKAQQLLKVGYRKLVSFESQDSGYEWFGANPAHEALTAYGLMEFSDMAKVMQVDDIMIKRTRQWLLDRRDGKGGFKRNERALDSFGRAPAPTTNAYIVWSLLESGQNADSLSQEIERVKATALSSNDSYIDALVANILFLSGDHITAQVLAKKLASAADSHGAVVGSTTSITGSGGDALAIETTSLALLAWLRYDEQWAAQVETSVKWLFERSKSGRFGSTQSTVLALKAIIAYDTARAAPKQPGSIQLKIDGQTFGKPVPFTRDSKGAIELPDFASELTSGKHDIELKMTDGSKMPFALEISYNTSKPENSAITPIHLSTKLGNATITEGDPVELLLSVSVGENSVPTPIAIIGIPAGLELRHEQLKELVSAERISAYEVRQSELVLYWRALRANEKRVLPIGLTAAIPGKYTAPSSRIYPYYTDEQKLWVGGHSVSIVARQ